MTAAGNGRSRPAQAAPFPTTKPRVTPATDTNEHPADSLLPQLAGWVKEKRTSAEIFQAPESRQHFDVWNFPAVDTLSLLQPKKKAALGA